MDVPRSGARGPGSDGDEFRLLIDRPTPELDSRRLWRRIEANLPPRSPSARGVSASTGRWHVPRLVWGFAALAVLTLAVWLAFEALGPAREPHMVLLTPALPTLPDSGVAAQPQPISPADVSAGAGTRDVSAGAGTRAPEDSRPHLDVRLVRGYDGAPPRDVSVAAAQGAGGADALRDARASIEALLPFESFGLVGAGRTELADDAALEVVLSGDYRLVVRAVETGVRPGEMVRLSNVELVGRGQESLPADLNLEPGKVYVLGVLPADAENPELVLLIRVQFHQDEGS